MKRMEYYKLGIATYRIRLFKLKCGNYHHSNRNYSIFERHCQFHPKLNYKHIRSNITEIEDNVKARRLPPIDFAKFALLYDESQCLKYEIETLRRKRNANSNNIQTLKREKSLSLSQTGMTEYINLGRNIKKDLMEKEHRLEDLEKQLFEIAQDIPNNTHPDTPIGAENQSKVLEEIGKPREELNWTLKSHTELCKLHDLSDFERGGKVAGTSFYFLKNWAALLELALIQYAVTKCVKKGFIPIMSPDVVRSEVINACGFKPRSNDPYAYYIEQSVEESHISRHGQDPRQLALSATAEFPLAAMYSNEVITQELPIKMVGFSHAFRAEGQAGQINRGLYRVHQFTKVEMFALSQANQSEFLLEEFRSIQKEIFSDLGLTFR